MSLPHEGIVDPIATRRVVLEAFDDCLPMLMIPKHAQIMIADKVIEELGLESFMPSAMRGTGNV